MHRFTPTSMVTVRQLELNIMTLDLTRKVIQTLHTDFDDILYEKLSIIKTYILNFSRPIATDIL